MSFSGIFDYKIPKVVIIRSIPLKLICRLIQILLLLYGISYLIIHKKGYQERSESITSSVILNITDIHYNPIKQNQSLIIDDADYIVPSQEKDALFLMTNSIQTDQEYKKCSESFNVNESACVNDNHCQSNRDLKNRNGKWTGRCLKEIGRCELKGWCPVINDFIVPTPSNDTLNFRLIIKNFIEFKRFQLIRNNFAADISYRRQEKCNYDPVNRTTCPMFRIGTLLDIVEPDLNEQINMLKYGGVILIQIHWLCNLDRSLDRCMPYYSFRRLDSRFDKMPYSAGYNSRFASHWKHKNRSFRTLTEAFGLRFFVSVSGEASRFHITTFILNIGLLIGGVCLITFIFDIIGLHIYSRLAVDRSQKSRDVVKESKCKNEQARLPA